MRQARQSLSLGINWFFAALQARINAAAGGLVDLFPHTTIEK
jgi:hypothetical protein